MSVPSHVFTQENFAPANRDKPNRIHGIHASGVCVIWQCVEACGNNLKKAKFLLPA